MLGKIVLIIGLSAYSSAQLDVDLGGIIKEGMKIDIQRDIEGLLPQMNQLVEQSNLATVNLPNVVCRKKGPMFSGVKFQGLNHMSSVESGVATIMGPDSLEVRTSITLKDAVLSAEKAMKSATDLTWDIGSLTLNIDLSMLPKSSGQDQCYTKYNSVEITDMSNVVQHSTDSHLDPKTPEKEIIDKVIGYYNRFLKNPKALRVLGSKLDICKPSSKTITQVVNTATQTV